MLATTSSRGLVVALLVSFTMAPAIVDARPVLRAQDAPPLSRSVGLSYQAAFESNGLIDRMLPYDDSFEEESFMVSAATAIGIEDHAHNLILFSVNCRVN